MYMNLLQGSCKPHTENNTTCTRQTISEEALKLQLEVLSFLAYLLISIHLLFPIKTQINPHKCSSQL